MARRRPVIDVELQLTTQPVKFLNGTTATATVEGNNAAWICSCGTLLIGRCYYQFGDNCHTVCPTCRKKFRVNANTQKKVCDIVEF